jgi:hypothetical protein
MTLHILDDVFRPIHVSLLLLRLASLGYVVQVGEEFQVVLEWLNRPGTVVR